LWVSDASIYDPGIRGGGGFRGLIARFVGYIALSGRSDESTFSDIRHKHSTYA